ncbi:MAG TPA: DUF3341 domain-containing protein [Terriglobales bacterium]|nr:DUF3341 domain-containing protein [Terriglobales bacterium]
MSSRRLIGVFENEEKTIQAIEASRQRGYKVVDVFGPHGSHEIERAMALSPSRIPWVVFAIGLLGAGLKVWFEFWTTAQDWPLNVGGKPFNSLPAFVPVTFEVMVLFAAVSAVISFFIVCRLFPGKKTQVPVEGITDDRFALVLEQTDSRFDVAVVARLLFTLGAVAVREQLAEEVPA